jgi:hypothetical protein
MESIKTISMSSLLVQKWNCCHHFWNEVLKRDVDLEKIRKHETQRVSGPDLTCDGYSNYNDHMNDNLQPTLNLIIVPEAPLHIRKPCTEVAVA